MKDFVGQDCASIELWDMSIATAVIEFHTASLFISENDPCFWPAGGMRLDLHT